MHTIACVMTLIGAICLYLTHRNQMLLPQPLRNLWRWVGLGLLTISGITLWILLPKAVAIFTWLILSMLVWSFIPFLGLVKTGLQHEH